MKSKQRGVTLLEVVISASILTIMVGLLMNMIMLLTNVSEQSVHSIAKDVQADRAATALVRELRLAILDSIASPTEGFGSQIMQYRKQIGIDETALPPLPTFSLIHTIYRLPEPGEILGNGIDDNGNGLIDEGNVFLDKGTGNPIKLISNCTALNFTRTPKPALNVTMRISYLNPLDRDPVSNAPQVRDIEILRTVYLANNFPGEVFEPSSSVIANGNDGGFSLNVDLNALGINGNAGLSLGPSGLGLTGGLGGGLNPSSGAGAGVSTTSNGNTNTILGLGNR